MIALASLVAGLVFGLGLAISGMTHPDRVLRFLDIADQWDPTLLLVMGGAVAVTVVLFHVVLRSATPLLDSEFHLPKAKKSIPRWSWVLSYLVLVGVLAAIVPGRQSVCWPHPTGKLPSFCLVWSSVFGRNAPCRDDRRSRYQPIAISRNPLNCTPSNR